jgi:biotin operon repressor
MKTTTFEKQILDLLMEKKTFLTNKFINDYLGGKLRGEQIRKYINTMRKKGIPIIAGHNGYKYTEDKEEINQYILSLFYRADDMIKACTGLKNYVLNENINEKI